MARIIDSIPYVTAGEAEQARAAAQKVVETHHRIAEWLRAGVTLPQIDQEIARILGSLRCESCFRHYKGHKPNGFPSFACLSVNDCVVHGTAASHAAPLKQGDILKIDIGVWYRGWVGGRGDGTVANDG